MTTPFELLNAELPGLHESAVRSVAAALGGARVSCFHARLAAESAITRAIEADRSLPRPYDTSVGTQSLNRCRLAPFRPPLSPPPACTPPHSLWCTRVRGRARATIRGFRRRHRLTGRSAARQHRVAESAVSSHWMDVGPIWCAGSIDRVPIRR